jgi:hypothetical protein
MKITKMNHRHDKWRMGYRYFTTWGRRTGTYGAGLNSTIGWLRKVYGQEVMYLQGPPRERDVGRNGWHLPLVPNVKWTLDRRRRRLYMTEDTLSWARVNGYLG